MRGYIYHSIYNTMTYFTGDLTAYGPRMTVFIKSFGTDPIDGNPLGQLLCLQKHPEGGGLVLTPFIDWTYESGNPDVTAAALEFYRGYWPGTEEQTRNGYDYFSMGFSGTGTSGFEGADYIYDNFTDFMTAYDNGEIFPISTAVYFDVYIDGTDKPSIFVNWTAGEDLSPVTLSPRVCIGCPEALIEVTPHDIRTVEGLSDPDITKWFVDIAGNFSYGGSYSTTYLSIQNHFENYLNPANKALKWGLDGDPAFIRLYLRMMDGERVGELYRVVIQKDGTPSAQLIDNSTNTDAFKTIIRFHTGEPDYVLPDDDPDYPGGSDASGTGPGRYDPDAIPDPDDFTDPTGYDGNAVLTRTYAVSAADLQNIGQKLWSQDYFDVLKIQSNPIENIVSVKWFPFAQTGTATEVKIGDVAFGVNGAKVPSVKKISIANKFTYSGHFNNFLDFAPFTQIKLFLPFIGFVQLDPGEIYNSPIKIDYFVDLVTGQCMARLYTDVNAQGKGIPFQSFYGNMGVDVPLSSTDRVQTEIRAASVALSSVAGLPGQIMAGDIYGAANKVSQGALNIAGMDYNTQRSSTQSPSCASYDCQDVYAVITRPAADVIQAGSRTGYEHLHGYPTNKYLKLSQIGLGKFVQVDARTDIQIAGTSEENAMLERMLMEGVYV